MLNNAFFPILNNKIKDIVQTFLEVNKFNIFKKMYILFLVYFMISTVFLYAKRNAYDDLESVFLSSSVTWKKKEKVQKLASNNHIS